MNPHNWLHYVTRSGEEGRRWAEEYRHPEILGADRLSVRAVHELRARHLSRGAALLEEMTERLRQLEVPLSIRHVLDRWYHGVVAYERYCREDFEGAWRSLDRANAAVAAAISLERVLLPLANHCHEFRLHQARISRNRRRWLEMRQDIESARAMIEGREPLCRLVDGTAIYIADLCAFFDSLALEDQEREDLAGLLDEKLRLSLFDRFVAELEIIPGFVIPYR